MHRRLNKGLPTYVGIDISATFVLSSAPRCIRFSFLDLSVNYVIIIIIPLS